MSSDYSVQKLLEKDLIIITGRNEKLPGHPLVYATSKSFMDYFGINTTDDLPKIRELLADQHVEPAVINQANPEVASALLVTNAGELVDAEQAAGTTGAAIPPAGEARLFIDDSHTGEPAPDDDRAPDGESPDSEDGNNAPDQI